MKTKTKKQTKKKLEKQQISKRNLNNFDFLSSKIFNKERI